MCFVLCRTYCEESSRINRRGSRKQYVVLHHVTWFNMIEIEFIFHLWSDWSIVELVTCELIICLSDWLFIMHCLFFKSTKWKSKIAQDGLHSAHVSFWWHLWVHNRGSGDEHRRGAPEAALRTITIWLVQLRLLHRRVGQATSLSSTTGDNYFTLTESRWRASQSGIRTRQCTFRSSCVYHRNRMKESDTVHIKRDGFQMLLWDYIWLRSDNHQVQAHCSAGRCGY